MKPKKKSLGNRFLEPNFGFNKLLLKVKANQTKVEFYNLLLNKKIEEFTFGELQIAYYLAKDPAIQARIKTHAQKAQP